MWYQNIYSSIDHVCYGNPMTSLFKVLSTVYIMEIIWFCINFHSNTNLKKTNRFLTVVLVKKLITTLINSKFIQGFLCKETHLYPQWQSRRLDRCVSQGRAPVWRTNWYLTPLRVNWMCWSQLLPARLDIIFLLRRKLSVRPRQTNILLGLQASRNSRSTVRFYHINVANTAQAQYVWAQEISHGHCGKYLTFVQCWKS